jgi:hypothetical protein
VVQTFLPFPDFAASAAVLDRARLGKQRVETLQLIRALTVEGHGWRRHPAARMWRGHLEALGAYGAAVVAVWTAAGRADTTAATMAADLGAAGIHRIRTQAELAGAGALPPWLGDPRLHRSHQSNLVRKDPGHYRPHFPDVPEDLAYHWPSDPTAT